jgi:sarcosine oxidase subunit alpha
MVNKTKDSIGNVLSERDVLSDPSGPMLVGLRQLEEKVSLVAGSHLVNLQEKTGEAESQGHVTSVAYSPNLESTIGLGFLKNGESRKGEIIWAVNPLQGEEVQVEVTNPVFVDTEGERLRV